MTEAARIIRDETGKPTFAVLPFAEYERLLDAADDALGIQAFDAHKAAGQETFPEEVAERLLAGESPVKVFREHRGLTQTQLADAAGVKQAYVSQIEARARTGSVDVLKRIAEVLNLDLGDLA